ncbi:hypothetical protein LRP67_04125 [Nocardioides sp. cx-169]|uniref:hypothetical protein n=1 Tax=Nocardioides sp. cx-169 TaxID=2899080 RepID=UPI001E5355B2|nr:hypothetical protein [Nocardioides sp. cx-169]MCD4533267.1 hypothetical protein [Nocardioides sp. cx-169]
MRERRTAVAALVLAPLLGGLLTACSDDEPPPSPHGEAADPWNPCDGITPAQARKAFGTAFTIDEGAEGEPRCVLTPKEKGGPAMEANYLLFPAGLDAAFEGMGELEGETLEIEVPGADDARLVISPEKDSLLISGFVQNGDLIQTLNLVDPAPFDRAAAVRGMRQALTAFSAHARNADVT